MNISVRSWWDLAYFHPHADDPEAVSGREVGAICDAVRVLGLRNELFLTYLKRLLRKDWDAWAC